MSTLRRRVAALLLVLPGLLPAPAAALRLMSYNLLNYSGGRTVEFRHVLEQTQPDVLVVQEILSQSAVNAFLTTVLDPVNPGEWVAGPFVNGPDTDNALFYRPAEVTFVDHFVVTTALRDIDEYTFRPATHVSAAAEVRVYVLHLKASQGSTNEQKRLAEVAAMRQRMETFPAGGNYVVAGDFNIYTASEPAFQYMTNAANGAAGMVTDPIGRVGNWHVNPAFADVHTQSTRVTDFGGGAIGGLDDRFDMLLVGPPLLDGEGLDILADTYTAFGQDGQHFDGAINVAPYSVVDSVTAQRLHDATDHLPVFADLQGFAVLITDVALDLGTVIVGGEAEAGLIVENGASVPADDLDYSLSAPAGFTAPPGAFSLAAGALPAVHPIGLETGTPGVLAGNLFVTSDDPDRPSEPVALLGTVVDHARPSTDSAAVVLVAPLALGSVAAGDTARAQALAHNFGYGPLQAMLEVWDFALAGDPRFFLEGGFSPALVGDAPAAFAVAFDAAGAPEGGYTGTLTLRTRDQQDLDGATDREDLVWDLSATVGGAVDVLARAPAAERSGFVSVQPSPFRSSVGLCFALEHAARADLRIYDVSGRAVRTLAVGPLGAGRHDRTWDGRDDSRREVGPGIYFARLIAGGSIETRKLVKVR